MRMYQSEEIGHQAYNANWHIISKERPSQDTLRETECIKNQRQICNSKSSKKKCGNLQRNPH